MSSKNMTNNQKVLASIVLITIFAFVGYLLISKKPNNEEVVVPAEWKTYTNSKYGYSIKYPERTKPTQIDSSYDGLIGFGKVSGEDFSIHSYKTNKIKAMNDGFSRSDILSKSTKLGGVEGYKAVHTVAYSNGNSGSTLSVEFGAWHNGNIYILNFWGDNDVSEEEAQILSTFKFTK